MAEYNEQRFLSRAFRGVVDFFNDITIKPTGSFTNYGITELRGAVSWLAGNLNLGLSILIAGSVNTGGLTIDDGKFTCPQQAKTLSDPPTQAELVSALGGAIGFIGVWQIVESTGGSKYLVFSDGSNWYYNAFTVGA